MCEEEVKVLVLGAWGSPFTGRVELGLRLKGVAYGFSEEDLKNKSSLLLESNPVYKKAPVFIHGSKAIAESLVILEYIEDTWGGYPLLPKDPFQRAKARFLAKFIDEKCLLSIWMSCRSEGEAQKKFMEESKENLRILEGELKGNKFFGGETIGMADIAANFLTIWADVLQEIAGIRVISEEEHPVFCRWSREFLKSDVVKECIPDRQKLLVAIAQKDAESS